MIKAVIFDFDGVLVESVDIKTKAFAKLFAAEGGSIVKKITNYHIKNSGISRFDKFKYIYKYILHKDLTEKKFKCLCHDFSNLVIHKVINAPQVKGAMNFLNKYKSKYKFFIVSATPQGEIIKIIGKRKMASFFETIYGSPISKKDIVRNILSKNKLSPNEVVYIGDALSDYEAACANGVQFIARLSKGKSLLQDMATHKIKDLINLHNVLNKRTF
jgi:HAD superfamily hydrolase (TIGR01549 family)